VSLKPGLLRADVVSVKRGRRWRPRYVLAGTIAISLAVWLCLSAVAVVTNRGTPSVEMLLACTAILLTCAAVAIQIRTGETLSATLTQARTDDLTGLGNRRMLLDTLAKRLNQPVPQPTALLLMDLDRFKEVNDSLGHEMGDELLKQMRPRLEALLLNREIACRLGGDEFAVVVDLEACATTDSMVSATTELADSIRSAMQKPFVLGQTDIFIDASLGIALAPLHTPSAEGLLRLADIAMYDAKRNRAGVTLYRAGLESLNNHRLAIASDLRTALRRGHEIHAYFQPKIDLRTEEVVGVEALVRWYHPTRGVIPPDEFVHIAEDTGQSALLTATMLDKALAQASDWASEGIHLPVAINLYGSDLRSPAIVERIKDALERHVLPPQCLQVEITEQSLVSDPAGARSILNQLHELGVKISLDDYGTGYSSLAYLREFPIDELKLDKTFAMGMLRDQTSWIIVRSTIDLAHALNMRIVAEGVEDDVVRDELISLGCDVGQGYYWSRPLGAAELNRWLSARAAETST
jgi:diguanylate cyclase